MNPTNDQAALRYLYEEPPPRGTWREVAPGLRWLRIPLPFALDHVNLWLLDEGPEGWALIDTGVANDATRALWQELFETALDGRPISRMIATHYHPDHIGLAGWMVERWGCPFASSRTEWLEARMLTLDQREGSTIAGGQQSFYRRCGAPESVLAALAQRGHGYSRIVSTVPRQFERLRDGDTVRIGQRNWQIITGGGHAPEQVCFYSPDDGIFIAADHVLPRITPNVSVHHWEPDEDPLADYVTSLERLKDLPAECLVLPSHGLPFRSLGIRIDQLLGHHDVRLEQTWDACTEAATVHDVSTALFKREMDAHQTSFAIGETLSHLNHLWRQGTIAREERAGEATLYRQR